MAKQVARTDAQWKKYIGDSMKKTVESIIETGKRIYEFKLDSLKSQGGTDYPERAKKVLGLSETAARRWAIIGENSEELLRNRTTLPPSKAVLDEILTMPNWEDKLEDITPQTTSTEVRKMKGNKTESKAKKRRATVPANLEELFDTVDGLDYTEMAALHDYIIEKGMDGAKAGSVPAKKLIDHLCRTGRDAAADMNGGPVNLKVAL